MMQQQDEHKLAQNSDNTLYERHAAIILAYVRSRTASWQDAEDLTLEVFLTALEHDNLSWLTDKQQLVWLWRVAHNKLIDSYRRPGQPPASSSTLQRASRSASGRHQRAQNRA